MSDSLQPALGRRLRSLRTERNLSLARVAAATGISASFVSQIEKGRTDVSVGRLLRLLEAYGVPLQEVLEHHSSPDPRVTRFEELEFFSAGDPGWEFAPLFTDVDGITAVSIGRCAAGGSTAEPVPYEVDRIAYVTRGSIVVTIQGSAPLPLDCGDSVILRRGDAVSWENPFGDEASLVLVRIDGVRPRSEAHAAINHRVRTA